MCRCLNHGLFFMAGSNIMNACIKRLRIPDCYTVGPWCFSRFLLIASAEGKNLFNCS